MAGFTQVFGYPGTWVAFINTQSHLAQQQLHRTIHRSRQQAFYEDITQHISCSSKLLIVLSSTTNISDISDCN